MDNLILIFICYKHFFTYRSSENFD